MLSSLTYDISTTRQSKGRVTNVPLLFVCLTATSNLLLVSSTGLMGIRNNLPYNIRPTGQTPFRMVYGRIHPTYFLAARDHRLGDQESISHRLHQLLRLSEE